MTKILDKVFNNIVTKILVIYSLFLLVICIFKGLINSLIFNYLTLNKSSITDISIYIYGMFFILLVVFIFYKFILKGYKPSTSFNYFIISGTLIYLTLRFTSFSKDWVFIEIGNTEIAYVDFIGVSLVIYIISLTGVDVWQKYFKPSVDFSTNPFTSDDPIIEIGEDLLDYSSRAKSIINLLSNANFKKSFTIGIVGPWGNGKSSLIEMMERHLENESPNQTIHLKFLPYLNHSESDIISEFFSQLSKEIYKYSGKLANYLLNYSDKLLKLYDNKSLKEFFSSNITNNYSRNTSIDTYLKINNVLKELDKKFIIFIDDLDRLSSKEVLQVLKLVRNTANFRNFIFVISLDKDYVLNTLASNNDIVDHTFVDKFFQLEVYLPEIDKTQLKRDFVKQLKLSGLKGETTFIENVSNAIYKTTNLFDDYISNHRSAKRLVNQLVFDFKMLPDELDVNDFLNFTYLKMSFPSAIKYLNNNWQDIIPYNSETKLRELQKSSEEKGHGDILKMIRDVRLFSGNSMFNPNLEDYKITSDLKVEEKIKESNNLSNRQNELFGKTIIALFGTENENPRHTSIKFGNNLRKLLQQKNSEDDLTHSNFKEIILANDEFKILEQALNSGKVFDILDRVAFYSPEDSTEIKNIISTLLFIFNKAENYGANANQVLQILSDFIKGTSSRKNKNNKRSETKIWEQIKSDFFEEEYLPDRKLEFLAFLSENRFRLGFESWGTNEETLKDLSLSIYKDLLEKKDQVLWGISDYSFYHAYHKVRKFHSSDTLNPLVINFWSKNKIKILCAQMTENEAWTIKMVKTSDHATTIFGSKNNYKEFIFNRINEASSTPLKEYKDFLQLEYYTGFSTYIRFEFKQFTEIIEKLEYVRASNKLSRDEYEKIVEIFVKSANEEVHKATYTNVNVNVFPNLINNQNYNRDDFYITKVRLTTENIHNTKQALLNHYIQMLSGNEIKYSVDKTNQKLLKGDETVLQFISVQPSEYDL